MKVMFVAAALAVSVLATPAAYAYDPTPIIGAAMTGAGRMMTQQRGGGQQCAPGYHPAPGLGCIGETITDRRVTKAFDAPIARGCVQGATRVVKVPGVMPDGRRVTWTLRQHAECNNRGI